MNTAVSYNLVNNKEKLLSVNKLIVCIYCSMLVCIAVYSFKKQEFNWDILPYMAVVLSYDHVDAETAHQQVYNTVKEQIPSALYYKLIDPSNNYRNTVALNAEAFQQQLPFYVVKPLYTRASYIFYKAGVPLSQATVLPSVISYFIIGLLLFHWIRKYRSTIFSFTACLLIMFSGPLLSVAKISTPDALSGLLLFSSIFFIVEKRSLLWTFIFLLLAILARIDNIIPAVFMLSAIHFSKKYIDQVNFKKYVMMLAIISLVYFSISFNAYSFGWNLLYYPSFAKQLNTSYTPGNSFDLEKYIVLAKSQLMTGIFYSSLTLFLLFIIFLFPGITTVKLSTLSIEQLLALAFIMIIITTFILQPLVADRIYIPFYLSIIVFLVKKYSSVTNDQFYKA